MKLKDKLQQMLVVRKLLENRRDSKTSPTRESSADVDVDDVDLETSPFWLHEACFQKMSAEQRSLNLSNFMPHEIFHFVLYVLNFYAHENTFHGSYFISLQISCPDIS